MKEFVINYKGKKIKVQVDENDIKDAKKAFDEYKLLVKKEQKFSEKNKILLKQYEDLLKYSNALYSQNRYLLGVIEELEYKYKMLNDQYNNALNFYNNELERKNKEFESLKIEFNKLMKYKFIIDNQNILLKEQVKSLNEQIRYMQGIRDKKEKCTYCSLREKEFFNKASKVNKKVENIQYLPNIFKK